VLPVLAYDGLEPGFRAEVETKQGATSSVGDGIRQPRLTKGMVLRS